MNELFAGMGPECQKRNEFHEKRHDMVIYKLYREGGAQLSGKDYHYCSFSI